MAGLRWDEDVAGDCGDVEVCWAAGLRAGGPEAGLRRDDDEAGASGVVVVGVGACWAASLRA